MNEDYLNRGMDLKRLVLYFQKKIWIAVMLAVLGATLGGVVYQVMRSMKMPVEYKAVSKLYISFGHDESGQVYQYYNGYTWNDLLDADPILELIMKGLPGYETDAVREATSAEILSDIRLLTITVKGDNEKFVREVRSAVESGLKEFARESEELEQIKVLRSDVPERVFWDNRTTAACTTGGVILGVLSLLIIGFFYALDESVYVQQDIEERYGYKALGILTRNQKGLQPYARELKASIGYLMGNKRKFVVLDMDNHADARKQELESLLNREETDVFGGNVQADIAQDSGWHIAEKLEGGRKEGEWEVIAFGENILSGEECKVIRENGGAVVLLPFGEDVGRKTARILSFLNNQDCKVLGMIISQADEEFLNRYFA